MGRDDGHQVSTLHLELTVVPIIEAHSDAAHLLREGDFLVGCGEEEGLREVYRIESTSCEASYIRTEASGLFTSVGCLLGFRFSEQQDASSSAS